MWFRFSPTLLTLVLTNNHHDARPQVDLDDIVYDNPYVGSGSQSLRDSAG